MIRYALKKFGKLFLGIAIIVVALFPTIMSASFFAQECDFQTWAALFTDEGGLPMAEGLMIAIIAVVGVVFFAILMYGFYMTVSSAQMTGEYTAKQIIKAVNKVVEERQKECPHDFYHQVGFTNMLACNECGLTFENKHFISE
jgi:hypothetical protein